MTEPIKVELSTVNEEGRATMPAKARRFAGVDDTSGLVMLGLMFDNENRGVWTAVEVHDNDKFTLPDWAREELGIEGERAEDVEVYVDRM